MQIADMTCHRVLAYVAAIQSQGYTLTVEQVEAYGARASRRPSSLGERLVPVTNPLTRKMRETPLVWLYRLQWLDIAGPSKNIEDSDKVTATPLGQAALIHLDQVAALGDVAPSSTIVLDKGDPIALAKVVGRVAELGPGALVDRFFREEAFLAIVQRTAITRVLMGPTQSRVAAIEQALADYRTDRPFEVRVDDNDEYHDRYLIPDDGPIWALGTSVSGVGDRHSAMVEIKDQSVVRTLRSNFERVWKDARVLNPSDRSDRNGTQKKAPEGSAVLDNGTDEVGSFAGDEAATGDV